GRYGGFHDARSVRVPVHDRPRTGLSPWRVGSPRLERSLQWSRGRIPLLEHAAVSAEILVMKMRPGYYVILLLGLAVVLAALGAMVLLLLNIPYQFTSWWLSFGVTMLLFFLIVVIARYIILLWLGYLHHLESRMEEDDPSDLFEPPVTIIVPAYNEGAVIEQAI